MIFQPSAYSESRFEPFICVWNDSSNQTEQRRYDGGNYIAKIVEVMADKYYEKLLEINRKY